MKKITQAIIAQAREELAQDKKREQVLTAKEILVQIEALEEAVNELKAQLKDL